MGEQRPASRGKMRAFVAVTVACAAVAVGAVVVGATRGPDAAEPAGGAARSEPLPRGALGFLSLDHDDRSAYGRIGVASAENPARARTVRGMGCHRIHLAGGRGLCLRRGDAFGSSLTAQTFGRDMRPRHKLSLSGSPSRARVSPDGRYGAVTAFVTGHSYVDQGSFSTQTTLVDMRRGKELADLEDFAVTRDGRRFRSIDFNFWGVTFARDSDRFYATLGSGGKTYLIEGSVRGRRAKVLRENAECPSLSPDGERMVYKKRKGGSGRWRHHALDLRTGRETALAEARPIDDQAEWLDDERILYALGVDTWVVPADGTGRPREYLAEAQSPTVIR